MLAINTYRSTFSQKPGRKKKGKEPHIKRAWSAMVGKNDEEMTKKFLNFWFGYVVWTLI